MSKKELIQRLKEIKRRQINRGSDIESDHVEADNLLLRFIDDHRVTETYEDIERWYA